jgi:hypothetical protein
LRGRILTPFITLLAAGSFDAGAYPEKEDGAELDAIARIERAAVLLIAATRQLRRIGMLPARPNAAAE